MPDRTLYLVNYVANIIPPDYKCDNCGATGCKLWREHRVHPDFTKLLCAVCAAKDQYKDITDIDEDGLHIGRWGTRIDQIGIFIPAIPVEGKNNYWCYKSMPKAGSEWWKKLPTLPDHISF